MKIIHEILTHNTDALRLSLSDAAPRKNNMRIHHHAMIELSLILYGKGTYKTNNRSYLIREGDVFFFRPNEAHCITDIEGNGMTILNLHIAPQFLYSSLQNALNSEYIKILPANFPILSNKINEVVLLEDAKEIQTLLLNIKTEFETQKGDYLPLVLNYICVILIKIARSCSNASLSKGDKQNYERMIAAVNYIDSHFKSSLTLEEIASKIGYSRCHFSYIFSKCMGMTVWDYVCIKRIEEALFLIKTTDKNILQIATECGFNNTINFNKIFKKYTNLSPHSFRKK